MANNGKFLDSAGLAVLWVKIKAAITAAVPTKTSQLTNDSGYVKASDIPEGAAASATLPKEDGTASAGTETAFARGDHVHPSDTTKVDKVDGKGLSTNDYTTAEKNKLSGIETGANKTTVDTAMSAISTNPVQNKVVNTALGGKADKATTLGGYGITDAYTKSEIDTKLGSVMNYKGTKNAVDELPTNAVTGDVWNISTAGTGNGVTVRAGDNVAWNGSGWDVLAGTVTIDTLTTEEINAITAQ